VQEPFTHQLIEERTARRAIDVPESAGLSEIQPQSRHFIVLAANTEQKFSV
jgi:hypothetical protein